MRRYNDGIRFAPAPPTTVVTPTDPPDPEESQSEPSVEGIPTVESPAGIAPVDQHKSQQFLLPGK